MIVVGLDPGLRVTGYGAVDDAGGRLRLVEAGVVAPHPSAPLEVRLGDLHREIRAVLSDTRAELVVIEELWTAYRNPTTAVLMGHARGVLYLAAHEHGAEVRALAHSRVKRVIAGSGAAPKEQVKRAVVRLLGLRVAPQPDDVSDALALAIACANIERVERRAAG